MAAAQETGEERRVHRGCARAAEAGEQLLEALDVAHGDGDEDDQAHHHLEGVGRDAQEVEAVGGHGDQGDAQERAEDGPPAPAQACPAEDDGGQDIELAAVEGVGDDLLDVVRLHQPADAGTDAEPAIGEEVHGRDIDADPPGAVGVVAHGVELAAEAGAAQEEPGGDHHGHHDDHRQGQEGEAVGHLELDDDDPIQPPVGQVVDRPPMREEHQQAEEDVERGDGDDDRNDAEIVDQAGVDSAEHEAEGHRQHEADGPVAAAELHHGDGNEVLGDRGGHGERDVDAAGHQHDQQAHRQDDVEGADIEQVEEVGERQEGVGGEAEEAAEEQDDDDQPGLGRARDEAAGCRGLGALESRRLKHGRRSRCSPWARRPGGIRR